MMTMVINKDVGKTNTNNTRSTSNGTGTPSSRVKAMPPLTLYRPPAARSDSRSEKCRQEPQSPLAISQTTCKTTSSSTPNLNRSQIQPQTTSQKKIRRPDQQVYVPRPRRSKTNQQEATPSRPHSASQQIQQSLTSVAENENQLCKETVLSSKDALKDCSKSQQDENVHSSLSVTDESFNKSDVNKSLDHLCIETQHKDTNSSCDLDSSVDTDITNLESGNSCCSNNSNSKDNSTVTVSESGIILDNNLTENKTLGTTVKEVDLQRNSLSSNSDSTDHETTDKDLLCVQRKETCNSTDHETTDKDLLCVKRKETCESDTEDSNIDRKAKQIHLIENVTDESANSTNGDLSSNLNVSDNINVSSSSNDSFFEEKCIIDEVTRSESDWEALFDDDGNCLERSLLDELTKSVGQVKVTTPSSDYRSFQSTEERTNDGECVIEIYGFPPEFKTRDLLNIFAAYRNRGGFQLKWVDDTHALGVFNSPVVADEVLQCELPFVKTRPLRLALPESRTKARTIPVTLPPAARPKTCSALARRLVTGALGLRLPTDQKKREEEKLILKEARDQRRLAAKQREAAWEGTLGNKSLS